MNIIFVGPFGLRRKGTIAMRALPLAKALAARGHQVELLLPPWDSPEDSGHVWDEDGVHIRHVVLPPARPLLQHVQITARLLQRILHLRPNVVHCFKPKAYAGLVAWAIWWLRKLGVIHTKLVLDSDDWEGAGGWNEIERYSAAQRRFFAWQERWGLLHCNALTVASRALQTIAWSLGVPPARVYYLPNGIDERTALFSGDCDGASVRQKHSLAADPLILLYTRFFEFRVERLVEIMRQVHTRAPDAHLLVVGQGLFGEEHEMLRLFQEGGLGSRVAYAGWVPAGRLPNYFAAAELAIYPFDDTLINRTKCAVKLLDLLAAGVPVVADAVGQNREYIQHERTGLLVTPGKIEEFAEAIVRLLRDESLRKRLGQSAREEMIARYGWRMLAEEAEKAYGTIDSCWESD